MMPDTPGSGAGILRWSVLAGAVERLSMARSMDDIVDIVRGAARRLTGADGITVVKREGEFCHYVAEDAVGPLWQGSRFPMSRCISGWAMLNGATAVIPDIYLDPRIPHDAYRPTFVRSLVMVPIRVRDPLAAIGAYWAQEGAPDPEQVAVLEALARCTATAIANVDLQRWQALLLREVDHRAKNALTAAQSLLRLTRAETVPAYTALVDGRLGALARAHTLLAESQWTGVSLRRLLERELASHGRELPADLTGPLVQLAPDAAQALTVAVHELTTNAVRFGACRRRRGASS